MRQSNPILADLKVFNQLAYPDSPGASEEQGVPGFLLVGLKDQHLCVW